MDLRTEKSCSYFATIIQSLSSPQPPNPHVQH